MFPSLLFCIRTSNFIVGNNWSILLLRSFTFNKKIPRPDHHMCVSHVFVLYCNGKINVLIYSINYYVRHTCTTMLRNFSERAMKYLAVYYCRQLKTKHFFTVNEFLEFLVVFFICICIHTVLNFSTVIFFTQRCYTVLNVYALTIRFIIIQMH